MKKITYSNYLFALLISVLFSGLAFGQVQTADFYNVNPAHGNGISFWGGSLWHKIHMGNTDEHHYGPVSSYSLKTNQSPQIDRGWTWGLHDQTPVVAINTEGKLQTNSWIKTMARTVYLGDFQNLNGNGGQRLSFNSNNSTVSEFALFDKELKRYGSLYGDSNGANFGILDGDGNWSYLAAKDNYTAFRINNIEKMRIRSDGKIGIGSNVDYSPNGYKLFVEEGIITEKVKIAIKTTSDWADYVFDDSYELLSLKELSQFIDKNKHLPKVPSAEEVLEAGIDVAKMNSKLLEKIEEAHLYILELHHSIEDLKIVINELKE